MGHARRFVLKLAAVTVTRDKVTEVVEQIVKLHPLLGPLKYLEY